MTLSYRDQALLDWFFSEGASVLGGSSGFGRQMDHARLYRVDAPRIADRDVTVWPSKSPHREPSFCPDDGALSKFGECARKLRDADTHWSRASEIFAVYFGDEGARWGRTKRGRLGSLVRFTPAGRDLLRQARKKQGSAVLDVTDAQRVENIVAVDALQAVPGRAALVAVAMTQAHALYERACNSWNEGVEAQGAIRCRRSSEAAE